MPDTGRTGQPEEAGLRADSVAIIAESSGQSALPLYARCSSCPGFGRVPTLHVHCTQHQAGGKDTDHHDDGADINKWNAAEHEAQPLQLCRYYPRCQSLDFQASEKEGAVIVDGSSDHQGIAGPSIGGKRKAEADAADGPVSPSKKNQKPAISRADMEAASEQYWNNHPTTIFRDLEEQPGTDSQGRGRCRQTQLEALARPDLVDRVYDVSEVQSSTSTVFPPQIVTPVIAGFGIDTTNHAGGNMLTSFTDELLYELASADEPSFMYDQL